MIINVLIATDNNYSQHCGVMLESLLENNKNNHIKIFLLHTQLTKSNRIKLKKTVLKHNSEINFVKIIRTKIFDKLITSNHISETAYLRIFLPKDLLIKYNTFLYLDCDVIVLKNLKQLFLANINSFPMAACRNISEDNLSNIKRLKMKKASLYFNSGVMLINSKEWLNYNVKDKALKFLLKYPKRIIYWDQDALNVVLQNKWKELPLHFNQQTKVFTYNSSQLGIRNKVYLKAKYYPSIVHFTGSTKPWSFACNHPLKKYYYKYLDKSEWSNYKPKDINTKNIIKRILPISIEYWLANKYAQFVKK